MFSSKWQTMLYLKHLITTFYCVRASVLCVLFSFVYMFLWSQIYVVRWSMEEKGEKSGGEKKKNKKENEQERKRGRERELILARSRLFSPSLSCHFFFLKTTELGIWL